MKYNKGDNVKYSSLGIGEKVDATVLEVKQDGSINISNAKANFDYLISINRNGITKNIFCKEDELSS